MSDSNTSPAAGGFPTLQHLTPVLVVTSVKECLPFWTDRLGFQVTAQVPADDGSVAFAILARDGIEIMYQSSASAIADGAVTKRELDGHSVALFITVASIDEVERRVAGAPVAKARHDTFYGSTEIYVREPGGNLVGFAQMK